MVTCNFTFNKVFTIPTLSFSLIQKLKCYRSERNVISKCYNIVMWKCHMEMSFHRLNCHKLRVFLATRIYLTHSIYRDNALLLRQRGKRYNVKKCLRTKWFIVSSIFALFRIDVIQVANLQNSQIKFHLSPAFTKFNGFR